MAKNKTIPINPKWDLFIQKYTDRSFRDAVGAYEEAYGCTRNAAYPGYKRLLKSQRFQDYFAKKISAAIGDSLFALDLKIVKMYMARAFYDIADILNEKGDLVDSIEELSKKGLSCVIEGIDKRVDKYGDEHIVYKLADRDKALMVLKDYMEIVNHINPEKVQNSGDGPSRVYVVQRRTVEEWKAYYETDLSGSRSRGKGTPSATPLSSSYLEEPRAGENQIIY